MNLPRSTAAFSFLERGLYPIRILIMVRTTELIRNRSCLDKFQLRANIRGSVSGSVRGHSDTGTTLVEKPHRGKFETQNIFWQIPADFTDLIHPTESSNYRFSALLNFSIQAIHAIILWVLLNLNRR
jgi:hypothetical protein